MSRVGREQVVKSFWDKGKKKMRYKKVYQRPNRPNFIHEGTGVYLRIDDTTKVKVTTKEDAIYELKRFACVLGTTRYHRLLTKVRKLPLRWHAHVRRTMMFKGEEITVVQFRQFD